MALPIVRDRIAVGGERDQDAAVHGVEAALADEFGLEADRRAIGNDLEIMVGQPGQQRAARYVGDGPDLAVKVAFLAQRPADERHGRVLAAGGETEQHAVWTENRKRVEEGKRVSVRV